MVIDNLPEELLIEDFCKELGFQLRNIVNEHDTCLLSQESLPKPVRITLKSEQETK